MLMQKEFEMVKRFATKGSMAKIGQDGLMPQERHELLYKYLLEKHEQGIYVISSHEFKERYGSGKFDYTRSVQILRKYGVVGVYHHRVVIDGVYYAGFVYLKCNEHLFEDYMLNNFGVFDRDKFESGLIMDNEKNVCEDIDPEEVERLKKRMSYKISQEEYKKYKNMREKGFNRTEIANYFNIPRWKLVAAVDNANNKNFKELQHAN